jgi:hypothetical protein
MPKLTQKRCYHQSLILDGRYLFVFFGMKTEVKLNNSIEFLDLTAQDKEFTLVKV